MSAGKKIGLSFIGSGTFGTMINQITSKSHAFQQKFNLINIFTRSSGLDFQKDVLQNPKVQAVYICSPDLQHDSQAIACLQADKHVFSEKPLIDWQSVIKTAQQTSKVLQLGFHRRESSSYQKLKSVCLRKSGYPRSLIFRTRDPVFNCQEDTQKNQQDLDTIITQSVCHEIDLLSWLFPEGSIKFSVVKGMPNCGVWMEGTVEHNNGESTSICIDFTKEYSYYTQEIYMVDNENKTQLFGHDYDPKTAKIVNPKTGDTMFCELWKDEYV